MAVYSDKFRLEATFDKDRSLAWTNMSQAEVDDFLAKVDEGVPFREVYSKGGGTWVNPEHIRFMTWNKVKVPCPTCKSHLYMAKEKNCQTPEYHT